MSRVTKKAGKNKISNKKFFILWGDALNINNKAAANNTYDAIVVGSGIRRLGCKKIV